jgi:hypothetical protein
VGLTALLLLGCAVMAIAHAGVVIPGISALGPGGDDAVWPAVIAFTFGVIVLAIVALGLLRGRTWAWPLAVVTHGLVIVGALTPYRGIGSAVAIVIAAAAVGVLMTRGARESLLGT